MALAEPYSQGPEHGLESEARPNTSQSMRLSQGARRRRYNAGGSSSHTHTHMYTKGTFCCWYLRDVVHAVAVEAEAVLAIRAVEQQLDVAADAAHGRGRASRRGWGAVSE